MRRAIRLTLTLAAMSWTLRRINHIPEGVPTYMPPEPDPNIPEALRPTPLGLADLALVEDDRNWTTLGQDRLRQNLIERRFTRLLGFRRDLERIRSLPAYTNPL